ncbi:hypothetical protein AKJ49_01590 [candidate division MSBL1 archaeon SCGC-AAA382A03]|uniref:Damage-control phosphatase ARMT1-like metal-binding domain-containing protein n=1 Tax=candidate division MSBL1 archaeon SCGC-AAA382A03 TaxID=1698278 RepID=A0A133VEP7_9EURY|nr:hypothetical protein AKJ49_01590 [candidate division MSBL1 archaeon SCGC-AAA382A03]
MRIQPECIPCILRQALETCKIATEEESKWEEALQKVAYSLSKTTFDNVTPLEVSHNAQRIVRRVTGVSDPYEDLKKRSNRKAMRTYSNLKKRVSDSEDTFYTATKIAIAGNVIDVGPGHEFEIKETIENVLGREFSINHFDFFKREVKNADKIFYLGDNAGEIVFDRIFLEELPGKEITFFVRNSPILNDVTIKEVKSVGLDQLSEIKKIKTEKQDSRLDGITEDFFDKLKNADVVISKGQGNYEAFSGIDANIFYLLMVKCSLVAESLERKEGDIIIKAARY